MKKPSIYRRLLLIAGLMLVITLAGWAALIWLGDVALRRAIANADRLDPGWRLSELNAARVKPPAERNAFEVLKKLKTGLPEIWRDPNFEDRFQGYPPNHLLRPDQIESLKSMLAPVQAQAASLEQLIDLPQGYKAIPYTPDIFGTLVDVEENGVASRMLSYVTRERLQADDPVLAAKLCRANLNVGRSIGDEPFQLSQLVRIFIQSKAAKDAERIMALSQPGEADLTTLQKRFQEIEPAPLLLYGLRGERAMLDQFFDNLQTGKLSSSSLATIVDASGYYGGGRRPNALNTKIVFYTPGQVAQNRLEALNLLTDMVEAAKEPPERWATTLPPLDRRSNSLPTIVRIFLPARVKASDAAIRNHALMRSIIVALASERFRIQKTRWPNSQQELVDAKLLGAMLLDPYDGEPIRIKKSDDGLVVYAVGPDRTDDGGKLFTTTLHPGMDLGYRLFDVAARRKPALPAPPPEEGDTPPPLEVQPSDPKP